jgi:hypothetical protein
MSWERGGSHKSSQGDDCLDCIITRYVASGKIMAASLYIMALRKKHADEERKVSLSFEVLRQGMHGKKQFRNNHVFALASLPRVLRFVMLVNAQLFCFS